MPDFGAGLRSATADNHRGWERDGKGYPVVRNNLAEQCNRFFLPSAASVWTYYRWNGRELWARRAAQCWRSDESGPVWHAGDRPAML